MYWTLKGRIHNTLNLHYKVILSYLNVSKAKLVAVKSLHRNFFCPLNSVMQCIFYLLISHPTWSFICISALLWNLHQCIKLHHCHKKKPGRVALQQPCFAMISFQLIIGMVHRVTSTSLCMWATLLFLLLNNEKISGSPALKLKNSLAWKCEMKKRMQKQLGAFFIKKLMFFLF